ncbi:MAG: cupin domain-containing protein [Siculibacillus sp.]|nr:cupin domain-containing protein [Siculibacillus sp.]
MPDVVALSLAPIERLEDRIAPEKLVSGDPATGLRPAHENAEAGFYTGVWQSEVGAWRVAYDEDELCVILVGRVRLTEDGGAPREFGPGEAFVVPRGFRGVWETVEPLRKIYAIAG